MFKKPVKCINDAVDMDQFQQSLAYERILDLVNRVSQCVCLKKVPESCSSDNKGIRAVVDLLTKLDNTVDNVPPDTGPRRFGNISFRKWHDELEKIEINIPMDDANTDVSNIMVELGPYFLGAFGSKQRLDYGTGHELSFLAFIGILLYTNIINDPSGEDLLYMFHTYFKLIQRLVLTYTLEPAGSHGVWGLDDHFHLPYIFGSAQIVDINEPETPTPDLPPSSILDAKVVDQLAPTNLYFDSIRFITEVKKGPFHEHSPVLYGVTQVQTWQKVHKGMIKMYVGEVLAKFPVVQHFIFGSIFSWESAKKDKNNPTEK